MTKVIKLSYESIDGGFTGGMFEEWVGHKLEREVYFGSAEDMREFLNREFGVEALPKE